MRPSQLFAAVLAMSSVAAAMPDAFDNMHALGDVRELLFGRQDNNNNNNDNNNNNNNNNDNNNDNNNNSPTPSATPTPAKATSDKAGNTPAASATESRNNNDNDEEASPTAKSTGSGKASGKASGTRTTTGKPKASNFDPRLPAGGITMVTPNVFAGEQYYKVGDWVTFAWNYTSLSVTPSNLDILATCTANQATYTIAVNQSAQQTSVLWNTGDAPEGQAPFLTEKYTLLIYDAESSATAAAKAGYLAPFNALTFGMYTPQPYVPYGDFDCVNCDSGALSHFEKMTLKAVMITSGTTIASLLYFTYNFGLW